MSQFNFRVRSPVPYRIHSKEDDNVAASPVAAVAYGTWPCQIQLLYCDSLGSDAGHRIAAAAFLDLNAIAVARVREWASRPTTLK